MTKKNKKMFSISREVLDDDYESWESYMLSKYSDEYISMKKIIISDCDGILTDGNLTYSIDNDGKFAKTYGCHDKEMYKLAKKLGWEFKFVTNDSVGKDITDKRLSSSLHEKSILGDGNYRNCLVNKYKALGYLVVFIGDSPSDVKAASNAHISATTENVFKPIQKYFNYVSIYKGGHGGFADIIYELVKMDENELYEYITD